jgi:hypothetical protein
MAVDDVAGNTSTAQTRFMKIVAENGLSGPKSPKIAQNRPTLTIENGLLCEAERS